jgi:hypothetical protein
LTISRKTKVREITSQQTKPALIGTDKKKSNLFIAVLLFLLLCPHLSFPGLPNDFERFRSNVQEESWVSSPLLPD